MICFTSIFGWLFFITMENISSRHFRRLVNNSVENELNHEYENSNQSSDEEIVVDLEEELLPVEIQESDFAFTQDRVFLNSVNFYEVLNDNIDLTDFTEPNN